MGNPVDAILGTQTTSSGIIRNDDPGDVLPVYRFAKISNGAYFFTGSLGERNQIIASFPDFRAEGVGFFAYAEASAGAPVYRFANLNNGGYFFTGSEAERDATIANYPNMRYEGSTFSVASSTAPGAQPVYRLANLTNGGYLYTTAAAERDAALSLGFWRNEGISFYAFCKSNLFQTQRASNSSLCLFAVCRRRVARRKRGCACVWPGHQDQIHA